MKALISREPFSYRQDIAVPDFDDKGPITVVDGDCALCTIGARLIARFDRTAEFRINKLEPEGNKRNTIIQPRFYGGY